MAYRQLFITAHPGMNTNPVYQYIYFTLRAVSGYKKQLGNIDQYLPWTDFIQGKCHISVAGTNEEEEYD